MIYVIAYCSISLKPIDYKTFIGTKLIFHIIMLLHMWCFKTFKKKILIASYFNHLTTRAWTLYTLGPKLGWSITQFILKVSTMLSSLFWTTRACILSTLGPKFEWSITQALNSFCLIFHNAVFSVSAYVKTVDPQCSASYAMYPLLYKIESSFRKDISYVH